MFTTAPKYHYVNQKVRYVTLISFVFTTTFQFLFLVLYSIHFLSQYFFPALASTVGLKKKKLKDKKRTSHFSLKSVLLDWRSTRLSNYSEHYDLSFKESLGSCHLSETHFLVSFLRLMVFFLSLSLWFLVPLLSYTSSLKETFQLLISFEVTLSNSQYISHNFVKSFVHISLELVQ